MHASDDLRIPEHFPDIELRAGVTGRRAAIGGGPDVWEIAMVYRDYVGDRDGLCRHFGWLDRALADQALAYMERFPEESESRVENNAHLGAVLEHESRHP